MPITETIRFPGAHGVDLAARLDRPPDGVRAFALFAHCFTCSKDLAAARRISRTLADHGLGVLRFDFTGLGESDGDFADTNFSSNVADLVAAANYLRERYRAPSLLVGHSLGGAAVLAAAADIPEVKAVATIGAPYEPAHVRHLFAGAEGELESTGVADVAIAGRSFRVKKQLLDDLVSHDPAQRIAGLGRALLVMHSPTDDIVGIDNATGIFTAARHPKSFVSLAGADHLLSNGADAAFAANVIASWADRYVEPDAPPVHELASGEVLVRGDATGFANTVVAGNHVLVADEPARLGGTDTGPTPYDYLLGGLGACTSMTLGMYARRKKWPLEDVTVRARHQRIHARDCEDCESDDGQVDVIDLDIELSGPLDDEQRQRLLEIAGKCPVNKTLTTETKVNKKLV